MATNNLLITGATGLVGSHLLIDLTKTNASIYALKRSSSNLDLVKSLFVHYNVVSDYEKIIWINLDLNDTAEYHVLPKSIDTLYHTAAFVSFSPEDEALMFDTNLKGTKNILDWAESAEVKTVAFVSSIAALGKTKQGLEIDESTPYDTGSKHSPYAQTKYEAEQLLWTYTAHFDCIAINPGVIIGPCDWNKSSGGLFKAAHKGMPFYTLGTNGFVDVRDVSKGLVTLVENSASTKGNRYIAVGENITYKHLFDTIATALNKPKSLFRAFSLHTEIGWRLEKIKSKISATPAQLTKETARSAHEKYTYNNQKLGAFIGPFITIEESIKNASIFILKHCIEAKK